MTRVGIIGAGVCGSLLAWRLALSRLGWSVELIGPTTIADATAASGGLIRGFERDPAACQMAAASLAELRSSPTLTAWSGYRETSSVYVCSATERPDVESQLAEMQRWLPGSARIVSAGELEAHHGWAGLPVDSLGILEDHAGYFSPARLRRRVLLALPGLGVKVVEGRLEQIHQEADGGAHVRVGSRYSRYDMIVIAAGRWTPQVLAASGLPFAQYRTKAIQYGIYEAAGWSPSTFVDDTSGLYGRPAGDGRVLLGLPSRRWDVDRDGPRFCPQAATRTVQIASARLPGLRLERLVERVSAADCYTEPAGLGLRPVRDGEGGLYTFSGGSGGAAKTALAASAIAARRLERELESAGARGHYQSWLGRSMPASPAR
jgi:glycine/D-amino acid oxidase-like deaminating enzyme